MGQIDELEKYETDYKDLVNDCRFLLEEAKKDRLAAYWKIAERIQAFRNRYEVTGFMETLHNDLGVSLRTLGYILQFRKEYKVFNKNISWAYYLELLTHLPKSYRQEFQKKILAGKIKNHKVLRSQIADYKEEKGLSMP